MQTANEIMTYSQKIDALDLEKEFKVLSSKRLLSIDTRSVLQTSPLLLAKQVVLILTILDQFKILSYQNARDWAGKIINHAELATLANICFDFQRSTLTQEDKANQRLLLIIQHENPQSMLNVLLRIHDEKLSLADDVYEALGCHDDPNARLTVKTTKKIVSLLNQEGPTLLTQTNPQWNHTLILTVMLSHNQKLMINALNILKEKAWFMSQVPKHLLLGLIKCPKPDIIAQVIIDEKEGLFQDVSYSKDNFFSLVQNSNPTKTAEALNLLYNNGLLNSTHRGEKNRSLIQHHDFPENIARALIALHTDCFSFDEPSCQEKYDDLYSALEKTTKVSVNQLHALCKLYKENVWSVKQYRTFSSYILESDAPVQLIKILSDLRKLNILTELNINYILKSGSQATEMYRAIILFNKNLADFFSEQKFSFPASQNSVWSNSTVNTQVSDSSDETMTDTSFLNLLNEKMGRHVGSKEIIKLLIHIKKMNFLDKKILDDHLNELFKVYQPHLNDILEILVMLDSIKIFQSDLDKFNQFMKCILKQFNEYAVKQSINGIRIEFAHHILPGFKTLADVGLMKPNPHHDTLILKANLVEICQIIRRFRSTLEYPELAQQYYKFILDEQYPYSMMKAMGTILELLERVQLFNPTNEAVFRQQLIDHQAILLDQYHLLDFSMIPPHLFTIDVWNEVIRACEAHVDDPTTGVTAINALIGRVINVNQAAQQPAQQAGQLNAIQSTHTASVHESVSEGAIKLRTLYREASMQCALKPKQELLNYIKAQASQSENRIKFEAAERCLKRIEGINFIDPKSQVSFKALFSYAWLAIHDDDKRLSSLDDAMLALIDGLYEMQRGYNLNEHNIDDNKRDLPICAPGSFNKIMEKLSQVHCDIEIRMITLKQLSLKFPIIFRRHLEHHLNQQQAQSGQTDFLNMLKTLQDDDSAIESIWAYIKDAVHTEIMSEFGSLNHEAILTLIETYVDIDIKPIITNFMSQLEHSHSSSSSSSSAASVGFFHTKRNRDHDEEIEQEVEVRDCKRTKPN